MGKKAKVNKLARMSDEERARYLQHRADMEEEARRRKLELVARFIKNKLDKEEAYSRMNTAKINQEWRYILRKIKCRQMSQDIQGMLNSFNYTVERKNRLLKALVTALEDSDEQHRRAFHAHTETVTYFLNVGTLSLDKLQAEYDLQKNTLLENWDKEEMDITDNAERSELKLKLVTYIQDRNFQIFKKEKELERATAKNDARLEHEEDMRSLCRPKQHEIEGYWAQLREVFSGYMEQHQPIMSQYQSLQEKDSFYQRDIAKNDFQIQQATDNLMNLQREWVKMTTTMASKLERMVSHKAELTKKYWQMKKDAKSEMGKANTKLAIMVNASQDAISRLDYFKEKVDKVLQLAEICKKFENARDQTFFHDEDDMLDEEFENLDPAMIREFKEFGKMDKFLLKVNRAKVQTMCLRSEKAKLARENVQLKHYIKKCLTDLALKSNRPASGPEERIDAYGKLLARPVTCIEGATSNAVMHEKRMKAFYKKSKEATVQSFPRVHCWS